MSRMGWPTRNLSSARISGGPTMKATNEVCARAAIGMSVEATALDLGIGKSSVLTYRQRAYQRLQVTSPFELSSLVTH